VALRFEWDKKKAAKKLKKHEVSFEEAKTVFDDEVFISFVDDEHSTDEERFITIGMSLRARLLMVAHTDREELIRIISARKATKNEEDFYTETS
jgi:uncharacterized protein